MAIEAHPRVAVIGGGSAAEQFCRGAAEHSDIVVYEPSLIGGECPFLACMPSKAMLHVARSGGSWDDAVAHRDQVVNGRNDDEHLRDLFDLGIEVRRSRASVADLGLVEDGDGVRERFDHIVLATGSDAIVPDIDGIDDAAVAPLVWTSADVYRSSTRPDRVVVLGGGVIGFELADLLSRLGSTVTVVERSARSFEQFPPRVAEIVTDSLTRRGVTFLHGREVQRVDAAGDGAAAVGLDDGSSLDADRLIVAAGQRPRTAELGLDHVGVDGTQPLPVTPTGRVEADGSVWAIGDVAGRGEYTHLANHHATVVVDQLFGDRRRTLDDVALSACMFTDPPLVNVGPMWSDLRHDDDVVEVGIDLDSFPRSITDRLDPGHLWVAGRKSTGTVVAAAGAGPSFDELIHAVVVAVDGAVPVSRLRQSMQPFPTIGEILGPAWDGLHDAIGA